MSLKSELQKLDTETVSKINAALTERLDSSDEVLQSEATSAVLNYPAINHLSTLALEQGLADGLTIDEAFQRGTGASHVLLVLTTLAEYLDLPPLE